MVWSPRLAHAEFMGRAKVDGARVLAALLATGIVGVVAACGPFKERVCEGGEYAARAIEAPDTGRTCVPNDQEPPPGYERFAPGQTPTYVEDDGP